MRRVIVMLLTVAALVPGIAIPASASSDHAAVVLKIDDPICTVSAGDLAAQATIHAVFTNNGTWKLTCRGELAPGEAPDAAVVLRSSADDPVDICFTPFGVTFDWQVVISASGKAMITCHGDENSAHGGG